MATRGRKSKLSENQWDQIRRRLLAGERAADLSREFGISNAAISGRFSEKIPKIKSIAEQIVKAENALSVLPISEKIATLTLVDELRSISMHLSSAARFNAATANRLSSIAHAQIEKVNDEEPMESQEHLQAISALTKMSNEASRLGMELIVASKKDPLPDEDSSKKLIGFRVVAAK